MWRDLRLGSLLCLMLTMAACGGSDDAGLDATEAEVTSVESSSTSAPTTTGATEPTDAAEPADAAPAELTDARVERVDGGYLVSWTAEPPGADLAVEVSWGLEPDEPSTPLTSVTDSSSVEVTDPAPGRRVYFGLTTGGRRLTVAERHIALDGVDNFRDLGGYETTDGRRVRWGQLYRSGELGEMTDRDLALVADLGIRLVCDYRTDFEVEELPDPEIAGAEHLRIPIADAGSNLVEEITMAVLEGDLSLLGPELLIDGNASFVTDFTDEYRRVLDRVADPSSRPTNIHCTAGKDRAGFGAAVILLALGVPQETVMEDYLLSNQYRAHANQETLDTVRPIVAVAQGVDPEAVDLEPLRSVLEVRPEYLQAAFDAMVANYGSVEGYLTDGLGLSDADLTALRAELLE